jgi:hypothetical protein
MQDEWHVQNAAHGQHTQHIRDTGHTSEMGRNHHKGYTQCEPYTQHKGHTEWTVHTQHTFTRRMRETSSTSSYARLQVVLLSPPIMPCSLQHIASAWLGWTNASVSSLQTLRVARGWVLEGRSMSRKRKECQVIGKMFQSLTNSAINSSDGQQHCSSASQCSQSMA